ncbi:MAG: Dynamin-like GTPase that mediates homotypic ER fusion [Chrysothrix sp. TS-e1954]|nr:MAG: Dynamin-like GTPase that mediates homotypic ER fusion [Chrysothrix sp. TS-e1954]
MAVNGNSGQVDYRHGCQVVDADKTFNTHLSEYLSLEKVAQAGFNYHLISVFGSQSTGKSTLLNHLFQTSFDVMSEEDRRQTTKGIWMSKNRGTGMADNILVMDVEGTDGRERGEDQDFERKSALFALATSEVLIVNMWENQVGLYQGANMALLKTVFEVNLQLFLKDRKSVGRSLLFFVIRDHIGQTPLKNLRNTILQDLSRIWSSISKPPGLEKSKIDDYFDFAFVTLPHKVLQPEKFADDAKTLSRRFRDGTRADLGGDASGLFLPEYHRRIPADGFSLYASGIWDQIESNKDLDLPTQQELLAQFRCDEIAREVLIPFDEQIIPLETRQSDDVKAGKTSLLENLGPTMKSAREIVIREFETEAGRYHKGVFTRKREELLKKVDGRLGSLFRGQLSTAHKMGVSAFSEAVTDAVRQGQKRGGNYDFAKIVESQKRMAVTVFQKEAQSLHVNDVPWFDYRSEETLYRKELGEVSARLRRDEMRRLATRIERAVKTRLSERVGLEFSSLGSGRASSAASEEEKKAIEMGLWDRIWSDFVDTVEAATERFSQHAQGFDASPEEVEIGLWRLRRKSWAALRAKLEEEVMEGNILLKLRENFEDKFKFDSEGVPRIWRPNDDIEGIYTTARASTLTLIPILSHFKLSKTSSPPPLDRWIGEPPKSLTSADEEDLAPIGGIDAESNATLEEEMTILSDAKVNDLSLRFKKSADGVYVEAKRSAVGGITQVPLYFYGLLLALGWNELVAVLRNPLYFVFLILLGVGAYVTHTLNLWGPMIRMADAASKQAIDVGKERLRDFLETQEGSSTARRPVAMQGRSSDDIDEDLAPRRSKANGSTGTAQKEDADEI